MLYGASARVYMLARSAEKAERSLNEIHSAHPSSEGHIEFIPLDLSDLRTIKTTADTFLSKESKLDVLWLNAGVMIPPAGSVTAQNYDLQLGTNCLGHFLLTQYLTPTIVKTAQSAPKNSVRVIWVSSAAAALPPVPAVDFNNITYAKKDEDIWMRYGRSKAGNVLHGVEYGRRMADDGVVSMSLNPGNLVTELQRNVPGFTKWFFHNFISWDAIWGAYTELYAGLSTEITLKEHQGVWSESHLSLSRYHCSDPAFPYPSSSGPFSNSGFLQSYRGGKSSTVDKTCTT